MGEDYPESYNTVESDEKKERSTMSEVEGMCEAIIDSVVGVNK